MKAMTAGDGKSPRGKVKGKLLYDELKDNVCTCNNPNIQLESCDLGV